MIHPRVDLRLGFRPGDVDANRAKLGVGADANKRKEKGERSFHGEPKPVCEDTGTLWKQTLALSRRFVHMPRAKPTPLR